jgi:Flp pilus assembly protein TadD
MFSSRSLHFAVLGLILGASVGYIVAFYQAQSRTPATLPSNHPPVGSDASAAFDAELAALKSEADRNPNDADKLASYAVALFSVGRPAEAIAQLERASQIRPDDLRLRSTLGMLLWNEGQADEARKHLKYAIEQDPKHVPTLHALFMMTLYTDHDQKKAAEILKTIESIDPNYKALADLRDRMKGASKPAGE